MNASHSVARAGDRALIYQTLVNMAAGLDRPDWELYSGSMTADVETELAGGLGHPGFPEPAVRGPRAAWDGAMAVISTMEAVTHYVMNVGYDFHGPDTATTRAEALITMLRPPGADDSDQILLKRGFRYADELVQQSDRWLIRKRTMTPLWMTRHAVVPVDYSQEL